MRRREGDDAENGEPYPEPVELELSEVGEAAAVASYRTEETSMPALSANQSFLHAHGILITPAQMAELVREAVARLPRVLVRDDPRADLTPSEAAALDEGGFRLDARPRGEDPLARSAAEFAALLATSLPTGEAAARLGVDPSRIRQRLTSRPQTLYGIRRDAGWVLPIFQFDGSRLLPGLGEVVARLDPQLHPLSVSRWFTMPHPDLVLDEPSAASRAVSPRDWLRLGFAPGAVADLAAFL